MANPTPNTPILPVYILRSSTPSTGQGVRGNIIFEITKEPNKRILKGIGEIDNDSVGAWAIQEKMFNSDKPVFKFKNVIETSEDFNYLTLGERIIQGLQQQLIDYENGKYQDRANLYIVSGSNPNTPPENVSAYKFSGRIHSEANDAALSEVLISDNVDTQGLQKSTCNSSGDSPKGGFTLYGQYIRESSNTNEIVETIKYTVRSGDTLSKIALQYPQKGEDGKDIPFYPDRTLQLYKANPTMEGRSIPLNEASDVSQVLENEDLIIIGEEITIPFYNYAPTTKTFEITFEKEGYISKTITPFTQEGLIFPFTKILLSPKEPSKKEAIKNVPMTNSQVSSVTNAAKKEDPMGGFTDQMLQDITKNIKKTLLPYALSLIGRFGISNVDKALKEGTANLKVQCPPNIDELNELIELKNKLTKQLNNLYGKLDTIKVGVDFANKLVTVANVVFAGLSTAVLAYPAIPFAPDFTKFLSTKLPGLNKSSQEIIANTLKLLSTLTGSTLLILTILTQTIQLVLNYLSLLDQLIEGCAKGTGWVLIEGEGNSPDGIPPQFPSPYDTGNGIWEYRGLSQNQVSSDLLIATQDQSLQGSPVIKNFNGFEMDVVDVNGTTDDQLKRRKAIARNKKGIIMLQGEPSFSSNDQILIDELIFYIKQNDLKAD